MTSANFQSKTPHLAFYIIIIVIILIVHQNLLNCYDSIFQIRRDMVSMDQSVQDINDRLQKIHTIIQLAEIEEKRKQQQENNILSPEKKQDDVSDSGFWMGESAIQHHLFDKNLSKAIINFMEKENATSMLELGAGMGKYSSELMKSNEHLQISCYDGNPSTQIISDGVCAVLDVSKPLKLHKVQWVLSLEVGEHIPSQYETIFLDNLHRLNTQGVILSWAVKGQQGHSHVNELPNEVIRQKFHERGYKSDESAENILRTQASYRWFKNTIMVFRNNN